MSREKGDPVYCDACGKDLTQLGGGYYFSESEKAYCPPRGDEDCTEKGMFMNNRAAAVFEFKSPEQLRKLASEGKLFSRYSLKRN